ncbi:MAG: SH3 domain-containing protein [Clostridiales bacterium]|nr:SH3 domain-containing protein [Clostridiales bacterium]
MARKKTTTQTAEETAQATEAVEAEAVQEDATIQAEETAQAVEAEAVEAPPVETEPEFTPYEVAVTVAVAPIREAPAQATRIVGTVPRGTRLTIQEESGGYGRTSTGATWIRLKQTSRR